MTLLRCYVVTNVHLSVYLRLELIDTALHKYLIMIANLQPLQAQLSPRCDAGTTSEESRCQAAYRRRVCYAVFTVSASCRGVKSRSY